MAGDSYKPPGAACASITGAHVYGAVNEGCGGSWAAGK